LTTGIFDTTLTVREILANAIPSGELHSFFLAASSSNLPRWAASGTELNSSDFAETRQRRQHAVVAAIWKLPETPRPAIATFRVTVA
jgi:hypothetical protein